MGQFEPHGEEVRLVEKTDRLSLGTPSRIMNNYTFDALANEHRRSLLVELLESSPLDDTVHVPTDVGSGVGEPDRSRTALYHTHLPKLADYGFIRWDEDAHEVSRGTLFEEIQPLLEIVANRTEGELMK